MSVEITCRICGKTFTARSRRSVYCSEACGKQGEKQNNRASRQRRMAMARQRERKDRPRRSIPEVLAWIQQHYEATGRRLSYGVAVARLEGEATAVAGQDDAGGRA